VVALALVGFRGIGMTERLLGAALVALSLVLLWRTTRAR
jgi:hypothetical protein